MAVVPTKVQGVSLAAAIGAPTQARGVSSGAIFGTGVNRKRLQEACLPYRGRT